MKIYRPQEIANKVASELNDLAVTLYENQTILTKFVFKGTADFSIYERYITGEYNLSDGIDDQQKIIPFIIGSISASQEAEDYYTRYEEEFGIRFYPYVNEKNDFEVLLREYVNLENTTNRVIDLDGYRVEKITGFPAIDDKIYPPQDGSNEYRFHVELGFIWNFASGIVTSKDINVYIDNQLVPYNTLSFVVEKRNINTLSLDATGIARYLSSVMPFNIVMSLPYLEDNPKSRELFMDAWGKIYNKKYTLRITVGQYVDYTDEVFLSSASVVDIRPSIVNFEVALTRVPKKTEILIDTLVAPVLQFNIKSESQTNSIVNINEEQSKELHISSNFSISLSVAVDENDLDPIVTSYLTKTLERNFGGASTIQLKRNNIDITYDVILINGEYEFSVDSNSTLDLTFVKRDDI